MVRLAGCLLAAALVPAHAAPRLKAQELQTLIESAIKAGRSDAEIARRLFKVELRERFTEDRIARLSPVLGPATRETLQLLAYVSAFLEPPLAELPREMPPPEQNAILAKTRTYVSEYVRRLPNFICTATTRLLDDDPTLRGGPPIWKYMRLVNTISGELSINGGREAFALKTATRRKAVADAGITTSGEFGAIIEALFLPDSGIVLEWSRWEPVQGRRAAVFRYSIDSDHSRFTVSSNNESLFVWQEHSWEVNAPYHGELSVEPQSGAIVKVMRAADLGQYSPVRRMETVVDYETAAIAGATYMLPVRSVTYSETRSRTYTNRRMLNEVRFTDYHQFGSESKVITDEAPQ